MFDQHLDLGADGSLDARSLPTHGGVYLLADTDDRPILLASCENLRRAVSNRLAAPPPEHKTKRAALAPIARHVHWRSTFSRFETAWAHWQEARALDPKNYRDVIAFPPAWFLIADPVARVPRILPVREFKTDTDRRIGPFATRRDAETWLHMLEDVFDLCRYDHILERTPNGEPCAYFEMGKCPAPCDGTLSIEAYRRMIADAMDFSAGIREPRLSTLREAVRTASDRLEFEKAAAMQQSINRATELVAKPVYAHMCDLHECCWLVVQRASPRSRSAKATMVRPFHVHDGVMEVGAPVALADLGIAAEGWLSRCGALPISPPASQEERTARCETLWLLAKFLFQGNRAPGLFHRSDRLPDGDAFVQAVRERFAGGAPNHVKP